MTSALRESKIIQKDGVILYVRPPGVSVSLARLANETGYRIESLCSAIDISPRHFRRLFDSCLGICPKKWLRAERMVLARNLLRGGLSIKEVSDQLGFGTQKDFLREFRQYYETAPSDFRYQETKRMGVSPELRFV